MPPRTILQLGDPKLWQESRRVYEPADQTVAHLIDDLRDTLADFRGRNGFGRGIAAPQIDDARRVIYVRMPDGSFDGPLINPEIIWQSDGRIELWDACFSLGPIMVRVSRAEQVQIQYTDREGDRKRFTAAGDLSELLQHEIDHLDGILAVNRAISPRAFMLREEWERQRRPK
jgi:peptide deformylase